MSLKFLNGAPRISHVDKHLGKPPIREIRIERNGPLKLTNRGFMVAFSHENTSQLGMSLRQVWVELDGSAGHFVSPVEGSWVQVVAVQCVEPGRAVCPGEHGMSPRVIRIDCKRLGQKTADFVDFCRFE